MNNQKLFLIIAIFLSVFLLWDKWQVKDNKTVATAHQNIEETQRNDIPSIVDNIPTPIKGVSVPAVKSKQNSPESVVTITTDILTLKVSDKGATIVKAILNNYPQELHSTNNFVLLDDTEGSYFVAEGGLAPQDIMPTHNSTWSSDRSNYTMKNDTLTVPFTWEKNGIKVTKNFTFKRDSYIVDVEYIVNNQTNANINILHYSQLSRKKEAKYSHMMPTFIGGAMYNDEGIYQKYKFDKFENVNKITSKSGWVAMIEHYFLAAIIPDQLTTNTFSTRDNNGNYSIRSVSPTISIPAQNNITFNGDSFYIGSKEKQRIEKAVKGLDHTVDYSWLYIVAKPLSEVLYWIFSIVGSWGLSIILLTILIKLAFYKLSEKSYKSMAGMRKLAPRLEQLKATYGDDKKKMGKKTMELYKEAKVNPASGCLPILVQMPVFISLYWVLIEVVELRQTSFLYLPDLSAQDPYYILPVLMGISMFVQQKLNPKPTDPMQAKIMSVLPIIFSLFFLFFPSGLVLYWVMNNVLSIAQQRLINKRIEG